MKLTKDELVGYMREMMDGTDKPEVVAVLVAVMNDEEDGTQNHEVTAESVVEALDVLVSEGMLERLDDDSPGRDPAHFIYACTHEYLAESL